MKIFPKALQRAFGRLDVHDGFFCNKKYWQYACVYTLQFFAFGEIEADALCRWCEIHLTNRVNSIAKRNEIDNEQCPGCIESFLATGTCVDSRYTSIALRKRIASADMHAGKGIEHARWSARTGFSAVVAATLNPLAWVAPQREMLRCEEPRRTVITLIPRFLR